MNFKKAVCSAGAALAPLALGVVALAEETGGTEPTTPDISGSLTTALQGVSNDALGVVGDVLPYALAIVGAILVVKLGIKAFKMISGK